MKAEEQIIIEASQKAHQQLLEALIQINNLFEALKQYKLPDAAKASEEATTAGMGRLSMMQLSRESAGTSQETNDRIRRHLDSYEKAMDTCKSAVEELNRKGASTDWLRRAMTKSVDPPWLLTGRSMVSSEADEFSPGEKEEYERLLSERALLEHDISQRNAMLQFTLNQLRDLSFIASSLSDTGQVTADQ